MIMGGFIDTITFQLQRGCLLMLQINHEVDKSTHMIAFFRDFLFIVVILAKIMDSGTSRAQLKYFQGWVGYKSILAIFNVKPALTLCPRSQLTAWVSGSHFLALLVFPEITVTLYSQQTSRWQQPGESLPLSMSVLYPTLFWAPRWFANSRAEWCEFTSIVWACHCNHAYKFSSALENQGTQCRKAHTLSRNQVFSRVY